MIKSLYKVVKTAKSQSRTTKLLNSMTDMQLRDIGLCRSDIPGVAKGTILTGSLNGTVEERCCY